MTRENVLLLAFGLGLLGLNALLGSRAAQGIARLFESFGPRADPGAPSDAPADFPARTQPAPAPPLAASGVRLGPHAAADERSGPRAADKVGGIEA
jgi:hypothetical protein